jgi:SnoaL-like domain
MSTIGQTSNRTEQLSSLDVDALTRAIERRDAAGQLAAYGADAELVIVDELHPPSRPLVVRGTDALRAHFADVCSREMTHQVRTAAVSGDRLTVEVACAYPDGTKVLCLSVAGVDDGHISWQRGIQAWDS